MELLTHGGEHHEIGDGGWLMMTTTMNHPLRSPERTPDQPSRERLGLLSDFFLRKTEYMELELRSAEPRETHEIGGAPREVGVPPTLVDRVWAPWS